MRSWLVSDLVCCSFSCLVEKEISIICVLQCAETGALLTIRTPQEPHGSDDWFHADLRGSLAKANGQYRYV